MGELPSVRRELNPKRKNSKHINFHSSGGPTVILTRSQQQNLFKHNHGSKCH